jgi:hypothetical protein
MTAQGSNNDPSVMAKTIKPKKRIGKTRGAPPQ